MSKDRDFILAKIFEKLAIKEEELIRPIVPVDQWVRDEYYVGKDGLKLYPFWRGVIKDVFESGSQYNQIIIDGGLGCRPLNTRYETSEGYLTLEQIAKELGNKTIFVNTEIGKERVVDTHIVGKREIIRLTLSDGVVFEGSSDHLLRVFDENKILFKKLSDIGDTDLILVTSSLDRSFTKEEYYPDCITGSEVLSYIVSNRCNFVKVKHKESVGVGVVGDIEVEGSHTYISDGLINHNSGKSTCGIFLMIRKLYELSCYKSIQGKFHLMDSALIVFLYFSLSKFQAKRTGFKQFKVTIDSIPYFRENFPRDPKANDELRFPSNVYYLYGTGTGDAIGSNMICSLIDEGNFFGSSSGDSTDYSEVADLHRALVARQESRFLRDGKNESLSIVISSNTYKSSYTEELRKRAQTDPTIKCYRARTWDIKPKGTYSDQIFYVFCGTDKVDPFIIEDTLDLISKLNIQLDPQQPVKDAIAKLPNELRTLVDEVPVDFKNQYIVNIVKALQDFSGFSVESSNTLFNNRNVFNACVDDTLPSLFSKSEFVIETMNDTPQNTVMYYLSGRQFSHPERPRFLHVDLGLSTDACGIACCYQSGIKVVDGIERPTYVFDFSIRIVPPPAPKKISIARTEEFLIYLRDKLHLQIGMISWDAFQSSSSQQRLQELGFPVRYQSVDRTDKAYLYFVENLYLNCVSFNSQFADDIQHELFNLIHDRKKGKVDHPSDTKHGGMKDRMDAIVGAMYNAFECKPREVNYNDTYSLSYLNSDANVAQFTEESSWLFDHDSRSEQIKEIVDQEYKNMMETTKWN